MLLIKTCQKQVKCKKKKKKRERESETHGQICSELDMS